MESLPLCALCNALYAHHYSPAAQPVLQEMNLDDLRTQSLTCFGVCRCLYMGLSSIVPQTAQQQTRGMVFGGGRASNSNFRVHGSGVDWEGTTFKVEFSTDCDHVDWPGAMFRTSPGLPSRSDSTQSLSQITQWFRECVNSHEQCRLAPQHIPVTVRVLNMHKGKMRLVEGFDINGKYAALSHCWGSGKHIKTIKDTLSGHLQNIPLENFPRTFTDALRICELLKIENLWIDSLCIVQDDPIDWATEAFKMQEIYKYAEVVLAGTAAQDSSEGLFVKRPPSAKLRWFSNSRAHTPVTLFAHPAIEHTQYTILNMESDEREPLMTRAWCLQEWLLARRMIHFSASELVWDCLQEVRCECGVLDAQHESRFRVQEAGRGLRDQLKKTLKSMQVDGSDASRVARLWMSLVEEYTARDISRYSDRMIAISGLAGEIERMSRASPYQAGFLGLDFEKQLLWSRKDITRPKSRPGDPVAPSWSWGSISEAVEWQLLWEDVSHGSVSIDECNIAEVAQVTVIGSVNPQSQQTHTQHLRIKTSFLRGCVKAGQGLDFGQCIAFVDDVSSGEKHEIFFTLDIDISSKLINDLQVVFLKLVTFKIPVDSAENELCGSLVVLPLITTKDQFERIGIVLGELSASLYCSNQVGHFLVV